MEPYSAPKLLGVLIYDDHNKNLPLIEQFRIGALDDQDHHGNLRLLRVLDGDESPETCIRRENLEESGCAVNNSKHLFSFILCACSELFHPNNRWCIWYAR